MGTDVALRQFLKSLCDDFDWIYAVFWKLKNHDNQMLLTWEDGYFDYSKPRESVEILPDDILFSSICETSMNYVTSEICPVRVAVDQMLSLQYTFGEGSVGKVACDGTHCWIYRDNILAGGFDSDLVAECPDEWLFQFGVGIKTILLVPVAPHGVLQLGSLGTVDENRALFAYIEDNCFAIRNAFPEPFSINSDSVQPSSSPVSLLANSIENSSLITPTVYSKMQHDNIKSEVLEPSNNRSSLMTQRMSLSSRQSIVSAAGDNLPDIFSGVGENENDGQPMSFIKEEEIETFQQNEKDNVVTTDISSRNTNSYNYGDVLEQLFEDNIDADMWSFNSIYQFSLDCELHKALGSALQRETDECVMEPSIYEKALYRSSSKICFDDLIDHTVPSACEPVGLCTDGIDAENLLDHTVPSVCDLVRLPAEGLNAENFLEAIVANAQIGSDDTLSSKSNLIRSRSRASFEHFMTNSQLKGQSRKDTSQGNDSVSRKRVTSAFVAGNGNTVSSSNASSSFKAMMSNLINEQPQNNEYIYMQSSKEPRLSAAQKKRSKPNDSQKRRPRDRQLIQDRVKELRELVPNGEKCSIDGLLDRTIKHMLFLLGVTEQAGKLTRWMHQEVSTTTGLKSCGREGTSKNGTSWAIQLGSELDVCPITVEDLECQGHMLIEMLCNDHGLFLEIAQVICELNLTIMKGSMKSRSNNTWAQFIVEVSKGFHRMDVFWPLMQLLQRNRNPLPSNV